MREILENTKKIELNKRKKEDVKKVLKLFLVYIEHLHSNTQKVC